MKTNKQVDAVLEPFKAIVPIVKATSAGSVEEFLGTGFIVGQKKPVIVTARHVLPDSHDSGDWGLFISMPSSDGRAEFSYFSEWSPADDFDVAIITDCDFTKGFSLSISETKVPMNHDVIALEYSPTTVEQVANGMRAVHFDAFSHKGNIMRYYESRFPEKNPVPMFDTSFPALRGASGAPVLRSDDFVVVGMLVSNQEWGLIPAQTFRAEIDGRSFEETKYYLPTGRAIEASVVIKCLEQLDIDVQIVV